MENRKKRPAPSKNELQLKVSNDLTVHIQPSKEHEFLMTTSQVAHGYDTSGDSIRDAKRRHKDELIEGKHFISSVGFSHAGNLKRKRTLWTKRGVVRLGFFIKSERARLFRDWAEDVIIGELLPKRLKNLRDDERQMLTLIDQHLVLGDIKKVANQLGFSRHQVGRVKLGQTRNAQILRALADRAIYNRRAGIQLAIGYSEALVSQISKRLQS